ncbi:MAG TPA: ATP-binding protein [Candidatus Polarisedimenticolia bacterium]|nr:ATP-binding protein [Candidatus Polarisedimenticolia bacterium]
MRRLSLSTLLIGVNVALVSVAVLGLAFAAVRLLRRLGDESARARVRLAGAAALQAVERSGDEALTSVHLLAERPTLLRLARARDAASLHEFLERFRLTGHLPGCAILVGAQVLASAGEPLPWIEIERGAGAGPDHFLFRGREGEAPVLAARAVVGGLTEARVVVALRLDQAYAREVGSRLGVEVAILDRREALEGDDQARQALRARVLDDGEPEAGRTRGGSEFLAALPLRSAGGEMVGLVEARLPAFGIDASLRHLVRTLVTVALVAAGLAILLGFLVGRWLVRPLRVLTDASERIGRGDLATPIPHAPGIEIGTLAATMEGMRGRLLQLTAELRRRQGEAEAVLTGIVEGVFSVDRERRIRYLNPQAAALLGVEAGAAIGRFCGDVLNPEASEGVRPCEERCPIVHARFRGHARATEHLQLSDGRRRSIVITSARPEPEGSDLQFEVMRDETEVEATRRVRDAVLANISHEFRTPLSAQLASIELLRERLPGLSAEEARGLVLSLERGTLRLTQLIDNLLESVRIEAGRDSIRRQPVALDEVVEEAVQLTSSLMAQREQILIVNLPYPLPSLTGDAPRLVQVLVNLLANANKFAPSGSTINIGGAARGREIALWVEDQGPGLPPGDGTALFARFVRSPGDEPEQGGLGLGLWIVKSIVERHGGRVEAGSGSGGTGTRVCVVLPRETGDEDPDR